ncbi:MAG TPA: hypothetical protein ENI24_04240 [Methylophaga sp.]|nr:hypothetical protein [Methylophaga sp.]
MSTIKLMTKSNDNVKQHVIFVHGLGGDSAETWLSLSTTPEFWPLWLNDKSNHISIWTIDYPADISRWLGGEAMHLTDRGVNLLNLLLTKSELQQGELVFIGHSLGGLVIKQILRHAESEAKTNITAAEFIKRTRRVAFLATPHAGSTLGAVANILRFFTRPSQATYSLILNSPNLRELNNWYRKWAGVHRIEHLVLYETRLSKIIWRYKELIVSAESADPGLTCTAVPIDADHYNICKPENQNSATYIFIKNFIQKELITSHRDTVIEQKLDLSIETIEKGEYRILSTLSSQPTETANMVVEKINERLSLMPSFESFSGSELIDTDIKKELTIIRKSRFLRGFQTEERAKDLARRVSVGNLKNGTPQIRCLALSWCARFLSIGDNRGKAEAYLNEAKQLGSTEEIVIAKAFINATSESVFDIVTELIKIPNELKYSAAYMLINFHQGPQKAKDWKQKSNIQLSQFDSGGKTTFINTLFALKEWDLLIENISSVEESDYEDYPALLNLIAMAHLIQVVPEESRDSLIYSIPNKTEQFSLASDVNALEHRNTAIRLFIQCSIIARDLGCEDIANTAEEYRLWLQLEDKLQAEKAKQELEKSISGNIDLLLRRFPLAFNVGINVDLNIIEKEIERLTALTEGKDLVAAMARFEFIFCMKDPKRAYKYIAKYRQQIELVIDSDYLYCIEIEVLAQAGETEQATVLFERLDESTLNQSLRQRLKMVIASCMVQDYDSTSSLESQYEKTGHIDDLRILVDHIKNKLSHPKSLQYSLELFEKTKAVEDANTLVRTWSKLGNFKEIGSFLRQNQEFLSQSDVLQVHWAWTLYREGRLAESQTELKKLTTQEGQPYFKDLQINIAITSGDWESLQPIIENEWIKREQRSANELLTAGQLAKVVQSRRAKEFIIAAAGKDDNSAEVLMSAYLTANTMGWEDEPSTAQWLKDANNLSDESGPVHQMNLQDLYELIPKWRERDRKVWQALNDGSAPVSMIANQLNKSLTDFYLYPALLNINSGELISKTLIPAFSNTRSSKSISHEIISLDRTSLLTLGYLGLLKQTIDCFNVIELPHSTLGWLFTEKQKVGFHQPSRIEKAKNIWRLIAGKKIKILPKEFISDIELALEIGDELAQFLQEAKVESETNKPQRLVVRPYPVHKIDSLMNENADLSSYSNQLCSCSSIVNKLHSFGGCTEAERDEAFKYLSKNEGQWPDLVEIEDNAIIYLDSLAVTYFLQIDILDKIASNFVVFISPEYAEEQNALQNFETESNKAGEIIESIRAILCEGIKSGSVKIAPSSILNESSEDALKHIYLEIISTVQDAQAAIIDDRCINSHSYIDFEAKRIPINTTLDLLETFKYRGILNYEQWIMYITKLRQAGYIFIPLTSEELNYHLNKGLIDKGVLRETAELRAIRENILQLKMSHLVQLPRDHAWLAQLLKLLSDNIKTQWLQSSDSEISIARSEWLLQLIDYRGWAHCFIGNTGFHMAKFGAGLTISTLLLAPENLTPEVKKHYWEWLEDRLIKPLKENDPNSYEWIVSMAQNEIEKLSNDEYFEGVFDE